MQKTTAQICLLSSQVGTFCMLNQLADDRSVEGNDVHAVGPSVLTANVTLASAEFVLSCALSQPPHKQAADTRIE